MNGRKIVTIYFVLAWCLLGIILSFVFRDKEMITAARRFPLDCHYAAVFPCF